MTPLVVHAGPRARRHLLDHGLRPEDVRVIPAAAGGPKGLALLPLDRAIFGSWLAGATQTVHLIGASIGAWRMAAACRHDAGSALAELADDYVEQRYDHAPGRPPSAAHVSAVFGRKLEQRLTPHAAEILSHPRRRLHVVTSRGRGLLARQGRLRTPLGYAGAFFANAANRRALGWWLERVVFSDPRDALPLPLSDLRSRQVTLAGANLARSVLASCSIPFWFDAVADIPGGPRGAYWDGGITDYHLHWNFASMDAGLVLYPHFQSRVVPGWLDKPWTRRHRASPWLDNVVVLSPDPAWIRSRLPAGKLPDRGDFKAYGDDHRSRQQAWRRALAECEALADAFVDLAARGPFDARPLI